MTALGEAQAHLSKAREFLVAAETNRDLGLFNAATSAAVISGILSKDAICLTLTGRTRKAEGHMEAVAELKLSGRSGAAVASTLSRLLKLKTKSQYRSTSVSAADASEAVDWATRLVEGAAATVTNR